MTKIFCISLAILAALSASASNYDKNLKLTNDVMKINSDPSNDKNLLNNKFKVRRSGGQLKFIKKEQTAKDLRKISNQSDSELTKGENRVELSIKNNLESDKMNMNRSHRMIRINSFNHNHINRNMESANKVFKLAPLPMK